MNIGLFILVCYAISHTLTTEMVLSKPREWLFNQKWFPTFFKDLITCPVCMGFHVGWILGIFFTPYFFLLDGFIVMASIKIIEKISIM